MGFEKLPCELGRIRCVGKGKGLKKWRFDFSVAAAVPTVLQAAVRAAVKDQSLDNRVAVRTSSVFRARPGRALGGIGDGRRNGVVRIDRERLSPGVADVLGVLRIHCLISLRLDDENRHGPNSAIHFCFHLRSNLLDGFVSGIPWIKMCFGLIVG